MKLFNIRDLYREKYKEYIVGSEEIGKHSVYLVYGEAELENKKTKMPLNREQAVYIRPDETFTFTAKSDCKYIVAGTHTAPHGH